MRSLICWLLAATCGVAPAQEAAELPARLRGAVAAYEQLVEALDLNRLPSELAGYLLVTDNLERLGEQLESLSREGMRLEELGPAETARLAETVGLFEADLQQLRRQSLGLRVWAFWNAHGHKKPEWGLAVCPTVEAPGQALGTLDAEAQEAVTLAASPGARAAGQFVVVPLSKDLMGLRVSVSELRTRAGKLPKDAVRVVAVEYEVGGQGGASELAVARDLTQAYLVEVAVPADQAAGEYVGRLSVRPAKAKAMELEVRLVVE